MKLVEADGLLEGTLKMRLNEMALPAMFLFTAVAGGTALLPAPLAMAQNSPSAPAHERHFGGHIEGHIAFLKAELNITPAQEALWNKVAAAMRADVADSERLRSQNLATTQARPTALQHLEERVTYTELRAKDEQRFLDAFRPLYGTLSDAQKQTADELLGHRREEP